MIYDFGANVGFNLRYYLSKDRVVAVEANPRLCETMSRKFADEVPLAYSEPDQRVTFYVHKTNHVLSQLPQPSKIEDFDAISVPTRTPASIVREHGEPTYIKIDVEYFDGAVLENLFAAGIVPPEISAEAHSVETFARLVIAGYRSFNLSKERPSQSSVSRNIRQGPSAGTSRGVGKMRTRSSTRSRHADWDGGTSTPHE